MDNTIRIQGTINYTSYGNDLEEATIHVNDEGGIENGNHSPSNVGDFSTISFKKDKATLMAYINSHEQALKLLECAKSIEEHLRR